MLDFSYFMLLGEDNVKVLKPSVKDATNEPEQNIIHHECNSRIRAWLFLAGEDLKKER